MSFVEDDVDAALSTAKESGRVVFVDGWAQWCHTCLSMQRDVLGDPALKAYEDRVVFAAVDTDRASSASFVARYPLKAWPTLFVIDPSSGAALAEHGGSLSLVELERFLDEALRARDPSVAKEPQVKEVLAGHAAMAKKDYAAAAAHYVAAAALPGPRVREAALGAMRAYSADKGDAACVDFGEKNAARMEGASSSAGDFSYYLYACADRLKDPAKKKAGLQAARALLEEVTGKPAAGASVDDVADALDVLAEVAKDQGDDAAFKAAHQKRLALLEADAAAQKTAEAARVHDYARMNSYLALGRGDDAVKMLRERTQQLPKSYEAWARLGQVFHALKRDDDALPAVQNAVTLSYGPRRLRYLSLLADVDAARGDKAGEKKALMDLVDAGENLPDAQRNDAAVAAARERLAKVR